jgi:hypothetical protein
MLLFLRFNSCLYIILYLKYTKLDIIDTKLDIVIDIYLPLIYNNYGRLYKQCYQAAKN